MSATPAMDLPVKVPQMTISHADKTMFPLAHLSKAQVVAYYRRIAPIMMPYLLQRPLTIKHFPKGIGQPGYYRKHAPDYFPDYLKRVEVPRKDPSLPVIQMATADAANDLTYLANLNAIEFHITNARADQLDHPDQLVLNLDPGASNFVAVRTVALFIEQRLRSLEIPVFVKLSGRAGLHLHIPVLADLSYDNIRPWLKAFTIGISQDLPDIATTELRKNRRGNRVYLGVNTNAFAQTTVAPYSLRGELGAPVAAPLDWSELRCKQVFPGDINAENVFRRLGHRDDPWRAMRERQTSAAKLCLSPIR